jgi:hypothetical protein
MSYDSIKGNDDGDGSFSCVRDGKVLCMVPEEVPSICVGNGATVQPTAPDEHEANQDSRVLVGTSYTSITSNIRRLVMLGMY